MQLWDTNLPSSFKHLQLAQTCPNFYLYIYYLSLLNLFTCVFRFTLHPVRKLLKRAFRRCLPAIKLQEIVLSHLSSPDEETNTND